LAGKTQVVVYPNDHQRTRLTHALEVAQVATSIARGSGVNVTLADAIALGHDCGHGPGGHASEDAFDAFIREGYDHGRGARTSSCGRSISVPETSDGIRNHSWSPAGAQHRRGWRSSAGPDRIAYCAHDLEDACTPGSIDPRDLPAEVTEICGRTRREQLNTFVRAVRRDAHHHGQAGMSPEPAAALAALRAFNYEGSTSGRHRWLSLGPWSMCCAGLVEFYAEMPGALPDADPATEPGNRCRRTRGRRVRRRNDDRYAFDMAVHHLGWAPERLPRGHRREL
jgi:dGTPase